MDDELNSMLSEVGGPCNYDNMIKMFEAKMAGGVNDPDDLIVSAFKAFDEEVEEKIKGQMVRRHILEVVSTCLKFSTSRMCLRTIWPLIFSSTSSSNALKADTIRSSGSFTPPAILASNILIMLS